MNTNRKIGLAITALIIAMLACNLPAQKTATEVPTVPSNTPTPADTSTPSTTTISVSTATNCRTGPGTSYPLVLIFQPGATAQVVGKYSASNYWIIDTPTGGTCWLWGAYATVQGNTSALAEIAPPAAPAQPTQVASNPKPTQPNPAPTKPIVAVGPIISNPGIILALAPAVPSKLTVNTSCQYLSFPVQQLISRTDSLSWTSVGNANGYTVYMNGGKIGDVTTTSYTVTFNLTSNPTQFGVAAYNSFGTSAITKATGQCP